jgi:hypothetical protein
MRSSPIGLGSALVLFLLFFASCEHLPTTRTTAHLELSAEQEPRVIAVVDDWAGWESAGGWSFNAQNLKEHPKSEGVEPSGAFTTAVLVGYDHEVRVYDADLNLVRTLKGFQDVKGVAGTPDGYVYVLESMLSSVLRFNPNGEVDPTFGQGGAFGQAQGLGIEWPTNLSVSRDGDLLVSDAAGAVTLCVHDANHAFGYECHLARDSALPHDQGLNYYALEHLGPCWQEFSPDPTTQKPNLPGVLDERCVPPLNTWMRDSHIAEPFSVGDDSERNEWNSQYLVQAQPDGGVEGSRGFYDVDYGAEGVREEPITFAAKLVAYDPLASRLLHQMWPSQDASTVVYVVGVKRIEREIFARISMHETNSANPCTGLCPTCF